MGRKFTRYAKKGDYMPVDGCHTMNLLTAIIDYYKRQPKRLKTILLNDDNWRRFAEDCKRIDESYDVNPTVGVPIADSDVTIMRGSNYMIKEMEYEFYPYSVDATSKSNVLIGQA